MKVALLADIHANAAALAAVLGAAAAAGAERLCIAGDYVGYYYDADGMFDLLDGWERTGVRGNHDAALEDWIADRGRNGLRARYGSGYAEAARRLSDARLAALAALPESRHCAIEGRVALICHGSPWDRDAYIYPDAGAEQRARFLDQPADLVLFGHTHYPAIWRGERSIAVNPGSVGQPRDRKPGACWALWDTASGEVELRREAYDAAPLIAECCERDPHLPYLADILVRR